MLLVFFAELVIDVEFWPVDSDVGVIIHEAAFIFWVIEFVTFIGKFGGVGENEEAVGEAAGDEELFLVVFRKDNTNVLTVSSGTFAEVDGDVVNFAF